MCVRVARPELSPNLPPPTTARICTDLAIGCATEEFIDERSAMTIPTYLPFHVLIGAIATITAIVFGLHTALAKTGWSDHDRTVAVRLSAAILVGWFLLALALALGGFYRVAPDGVPTIQYGLFIPILIGAWLIWALACRGPDHRRGTTTLDSRRAALSSAGRDLPDPLPDWQVAWPLRLASWNW